MVDPNDVLPATSSVVEGMGDEVIYFIVSVVVGAVGILAWISTHVQESPHELNLTSSPPVAETSEPTTGEDLLCVLSETTLE